jgi:hypothetical protein
MSVKLWKNGETTEVRAHQVKDWIDRGWSTQEVPEELPEPEPDLPDDLIDLMEKEGVEPLDE